MNWGAHRLAVAAVLVAAAACPDLGGPRPAAGDAGPGADGGGPVEHFVYMTGLAFCDELDCSDVSRIQAGDTVTWVNNDTAFHEVVYGDYANPGEEVFHSPAIQVGQSWSFTFGDAGDYEYYCDNHKRLMNMAHIVVEPAATANLCDAPGAACTACVSSDCDQAVAEACAQAAVVAAGPFCAACHQEAR